MSVTIGSVTFPNLTAQPFGYDEVDTRAGQTARKWSISGLMTPLEWLDLLAEYNTWRDLRILEDPVLENPVVGTTVLFSGTGAGGELWSNIPCWFSVAPSGEQAGIYILASVEVVDAAEALEVVVRQQENEEATSEDNPDLGTVNIGGAVLTLLKPMETYAQGPQLEFTTTGVHYLTGPLAVYKIRDIEGTTDATGWGLVQAWYESQIVAVPLTGSWFPISPPSASARNKLVSGVTTVEYTVSIQLGQVI